MKPLSLQPNLVAQTRDAILEAIASGALAPGERLVQERIAELLGVSRQPVQQALGLLRNQGVLQDAPGRGLLVAPLDPGYVRHIYDMRAVIEGLAFREAALHGAQRAARQGAAYIDAGLKAVASGAVPEMIAADMRFHGFVHELSGNPLVAPTLAPHITYMQRVMGDVLQRDDKPLDIWHEHEALLEAIVAGQAERAEALAREHVTAAASFMLERLAAVEAGAAL